MAVADPVTHTNAAVVAATAAVSVPVGDGVVPDGVDVEHPRYVVVHTILGGRVDGSLGDPNDDVVFPVQATCVAPRRDYAQALQHSIRSFFVVPANWSVPGRSVMQVTLEQPAGVRRDEDLGEREGRRWFTTDVFHIHTTPA